MTRQITREHLEKRIQTAGTWAVIIGILKIVSGSMVLLLIMATDVGTYLLNQYGFNIFNSVCTVIVGGVSSKIGLSIKSDKMHRSGKIEFLVTFYIFLILINILVAYIDRNSKSYQFSPPALHVAPSVLILGLLLRARKPASILDAGIFVEASMESVVGSDGQSKASSIQIEDIHSSSASSKGEESIRVSVAKTDSSKYIRTRTNILSIMLVLCLVLTAYCPHRIHYSTQKADRGFGDRDPVVLSDVRDYVEYSFIWNPPKNSLIDIARLAVSWIGIGFAGGLALLLVRKGSSKEESKISDS